MHRKQRDWYANKKIVLFLIVLTFVLTSCSPALSSEAPLTTGTTAPSLETPMPAVSTVPPSSTPMPTTITVPPSPTPLPVNRTTTGTISKDEIWQGEIHLRGDITFSNRATLTILPGTVVYIASNSDVQYSGVSYHDDYVDSHNDPVRLDSWDKNAITIDGRGGTIVAVGTPEEPIMFIPEGGSTSPAQWYGIFIENGSLQYAKVLYGGRTAVAVLGNNVEVAYNEIRYFHWAGIDVGGHNAWIHHNVVEGGGHQAITARNNALVEHNIVLRAQTGIGVERADGLIVSNNIVIDSVRGIELRSGKNIEITNNTIARIDEVPKGWFYKGELVYPPFEAGGGIENYLSSPKIVIENNIIYGPFNWGIGLHKRLGSGSVVDYNLFWGQSELYIGPGSEDAGMNIIHQDPLFVDPANSDFTLTTQSPAIDAGMPETTDADGSPSDLGAFGGPNGDNW